MRKIDFLLIGAQKSGTTWLWDKLDQHPGTDLPASKEIHYYGGVELYRKGPEWYQSHFEDTRQDLLTGEASTSYLFDRIPFWYNESRQIEYAPDLPPIPELVAADHPDAKIIAVLRDPVDRALSAYRHWLKQGNLSPRIGLKRSAIELPKMRILEYGFYARHLSAWLECFSREQFRILIFEEDIRRQPAAGLQQVYEFLGLEPDYSPADSLREVHRSWSFTRSAIGYYAGPLRRYVNRGSLGEFLDRHDFLEPYAVNETDIEFLRASYLPEKSALQDITGRNLDHWEYGAGLLAQTP